MPAGRVAVSQSRLRARGASGFPANACRSRHDRLAGNQMPHRKCILRTGPEALDLRPDDLGDDDIRSATDPAMEATACAPSAHATTG